MTSERTVGLWNSWGTLACEKVFWLWSLEAPKLVSNSRCKQLGSSKALYHECGASGRTFWNLRGSSPLKKVVWQFRPEVPAEQWQQTGTSPTLAHLHLPSLYPENALRNDLFLVLDSASVHASYPQPHLLP